MSASEYLSSGVGERRRVGPAAGIRAMGVESWILLALVVIAAAIRIITLDNQSLWADEALTAYEVRLPLGAMLNTVVHVETTPPLYFVLIWGWAKLFGTGAVAIRSLSAVAGVALVPIAYGATRELVCRRAGLLAAAFVACNPFMIWYSQEARSYMLLAALTGASFWFFARARRDPSVGNLGWWAALSAAALTTHFFAGFVVAPEALWLLWRARTRAMAVAVAIVAATQAAMLPFVAIDASATHGTSWIAKIAPLHRIGETVTEWGASNLYRRIPASVGLLVGAALALAVVWLLAGRGGGGSRRGAGVAVAIAAVGFGAPLLLGAAGYDYFLSRNEIIAFVPVITVLAAACTMPRGRIAGAVLAIVLLGEFAAAAIDVQTHPYLQRADWRAAARALGPAVVPRAVLAAGGTTADPLKIYLSGVDWTQSPGRRVPIAEVDVVGTRKRIAVLRGAQPETGVSPSRRLAARRAAIPRSVASPGTRLLMRWRVKNWTVARFALAHPQALSIAALRQLAPRFFRHMPRALLVFTQPRAR